MLKLANTSENTEPTKAPFVGDLLDINSGPSRTFFKLLPVYCIKIAVI